MSTTRECRRKHWRAWSTKTLGDGTQIVVCRLCGGEPAADQVKRARSFPGAVGGTAPTEENP